jgi:hypothetical protein
MWNEHVHDRQYSWPVTCASINAGHACAHLSGRDALREALRRAQHDLERRAQPDEHDLEAVRVKQARQHRPHDERRRVRHAADGRALQRRELLGRAAKRALCCRGEHGLEDALQGRRAVGRVAGARGRGGGRVRDRAVREARDAERAVRLRHVAHALRYGERCSNRVRMPFVSAQLPTTCVLGKAESAQTADGHLYHPKATWRSTVATNANSCHQR